MRLAIGVMLIALCSSSGEAPKSAPELRITSIYPFAVRAGATTTVTIRGQSLAGARAVIPDSEALGTRVLGVSPASDSVQVEITAPPGEAKYRVRVVADRGVSNELPLQAIDSEIHDERDLKTALHRFPAAVTGSIGAAGEVDVFWIEAKQGQTLTFSAAAGVPALDPSLTLLEPSGSWFDQSRLQRIAFNDEPLYFPGLSQEPRLVHRFDRAGKYALQIRSFSGRGEADFAYVLRISAGTEPAPSLRPVSATGHDERQFTRVLNAAWMAKLASRGGTEESKTPSTCTGEVLTIPGIAEGRITKPAEVHRFRFTIDKPQDLAMEVETPEATMPRFNPVVRLLAPDGSEIVTNVYTKRNNNGLYMMKMIQAKSTFTLRAPGEYTLEIRDITTDIAGDDFAYRVLIRPQVPHVGKVEVAEDRINLAPGETKPITVQLEREESFTGLVAVSAEGLPAGVSATAGMANPVEKPPLPNGGRLERYTGKPQTATLVLSAADDAPPGQLPANVRIVLRTIGNGRAGVAIPVKELPVMVIPRRPS